MPQPCAADDECDACSDPLTCRDGAFTKNVGQEQHQPMRDAAIRCRRATPDARPALPAGRQRAPEFVTRIVKKPLLARSPVGMPLAMKAREMVGRGHVDSAHESCPS
jgi:hypothetical protein